VCDFFYFEDFVVVFVVLLDLFVEGVVNFVLGDLWLICELVEVLVVVVGWFDLVVFGVCAAVVNELVVIVVDVWCLCEEVGWVFLCTFEEWVVDMIGWWRGV